MNPPTLKTTLTFMLGALTASFLLFVVACEMNPAYGSATDAKLDDVTTIAVVGKVPGTDCTLHRVRMVSGTAIYFDHVVICPEHVPQKRTEVRKQKCVGPDCCLEITTVIE